MINKLQTNNSKTARILREFSKNCIISWTFFIPPKCSYFPANNATLSNCRTFSSYLRNKLTKPTCLRRNLFSMRQNNEKFFSVSLQKLETGHLASKLDNENESKHSYDFCAFRGKADPKDWVRKVDIKVPHRRFPDQNHVISLSVLDSNSGDESWPTVVACHDIPGDGTDFLQLAIRLYDHGIRLISGTCAGLRDSELSPTQIRAVDFGSSARTERLRILLKALNISKVDMLLAHRKGSQILFHAATQWKDVESFMIINPCKLTYERPWRPNLRLSIITGTTPEYASIVVKVAKPLIMGFYKRFVLGQKDDTWRDVSDIVMSKMCVCNLSPDHLQSVGHLMESQEKPLVVAYSMDDTKEFPRNCAELAYSRLDIPVKNTVVYTDATHSSKDPLAPPLERDDRLTRVLLFLKGGDAVHTTHEDAIVDQIVDVLNYIKKKASTEEITKNG